MKALKIAGISILALLLIIVVTISIMSPKSHLERSIVVKATPASVLEEFANFRKFNVWSPWAAMDTAATVTYEGPEMGVGAKMSWVGPESGDGSQETIEFEEGKRVRNMMKFGMMEGAIYNEIIVEPVPEGTKVTWTYDQDVSGTAMTNAALGKFFGFMMDGMMGKQYEDGLASMKKIVESKPATAEQSATDSTATQAQQ